MKTERRRTLEKELQDILKITNPLVPSTLDQSPTAMSVPKSIGGTGPVAETKR